MAALSTVHARKSPAPTAAGHRIGTGTHHPSGRSPCSPFLDTLVVPQPTTHTRDLVALCGSVFSARCRLVLVDRAPLLHLVAQRHPSALRMCIPSQASQAYQAEQTRWISELQPAEQIVFDSNSQVSRRGKHPCSCLFLPTVSLLSPCRPRSYVQAPHGFALFPIPLLPDGNNWSWLRETDNKSGCKDLAL